MLKRRLAALLPLIVFLCGCGGPTVHPASGKVTYEDDTPVTLGGTVVFNPPAGSSFQVRGDIQSDGTFELVTTDEAGNERTGAPQGKYKVYLLPAEPKDDAEGAEEPIEIAAEKFGDPDQSGITVEIKPESNDDIKITVEKPTGS